MCLLDQTVIVTLIISILAKVVVKLLNKQNGGICQKLKKLNEVIDPVID